MADDLDIDTTNGGEGGADEGGAAVIPPKKAPAAVAAPVAKTPQEKEVLARAKRMAAQLADQEKKKIARSLGLENYDPAAVDAKLNEIAKAREDAMSVHQRLETRLKDAEAREAALRTENGKLKSELNRAKREIQKEQKRREDLTVEMQVQQAAILAGVGDADYALKLFTDHVSAKGEEDPFSKDPKAFFESLKTVPKYRHLFSDETIAAGPSTVADERRAAETTAAETTTTAPTLPKSPPAPAPAGGKQPNQKVDIDKLSPREFSQHMQKNYGFRPGA